MSKENTTPATEDVQQQDDDVVRTPDETEPEAGNNEARFEGEVGDQQPVSATAPDGTIFTVGDGVKIAESFPSYRGEPGKVTALRRDPIGGNFWVADVELSNQVQVTDKSPIWFNNVPLSQLVPNPW